jgi:hypothetical protein
MIAKADLVAGIRFAGERSAAAARYCKDWDHQLGHEWTSGDAFRHVANTAGGAGQVAGLLDSGALESFSRAAAAASNARAIDSAKAKSRDEVIQQIIDGHNASADFVATMDDADLAKVVKLGGYEMPKAEILAQIWIHHAIAHSYEASARWPLL